MLALSEDEYNADVFGGYEEDEVFGGYEEDEDEMWNEEEFGAHEDDGWF